MTKPDDLNSVWLDKMACILTNIIIPCMHDNGMTLECLDRAYEQTQQWYSKNATVPKTKVGK